MQKKPGCLVLDTNVILDKYFAFRVNSDSSSKAIALAESLDVPMLYTAAQAASVFYIAGQALKRLEREKSGALSQSMALAINATCWGIVDNLAEIATVVGADEGDVWVARKCRAIHNDFEDNLIFAAAERAKADFVVTNDDAMMRHAPVATISPADLMALLEAFAEE